MASEQAMREEELRVNAELNQLKVKIAHLEKGIQGYQVCHCHAPGKRTPQPWLRLAWCLGGVERGEEGARDAVQTGRFAIQIMACVSEQMSSSFIRCIPV
jgi:hypothetical protein